MSLGRQLLRAIGRVISAIANIPIKFMYVLLALLIASGGIYFHTRRAMLDQVGGKNEYDEAMRYIEIKDIVDLNFPFSQNGGRLLDIAIFMPRL